MQTQTRSTDAVQLTDTQRNFLDEVMPATIGTIRANGTVQLNPIWYERREDELWLNATRSRRWGSRLEPGTPVTLLMVDPANMWRWMQVQGRVVEKTEEGAADHIDRLSHRYLGSDYRNHQADDPRVIVRVVPIRITGTIDAA